ncbi:MAG: Uma2 family endonuclease [Geitlerinemataceae cyanobacterium]
MVQIVAPPTTTLSLNLPIGLKLHVTPEQFATLATHNKDIRLERTAAGELLVNPPTGWETGERNSSINAQLYRWNEDNGYPGKVFDSSTGFTLPNGAILSPDASWVSSERWDALTDEQRSTFANLCPDFVVELRSKSDGLKPTQAKMREYCSNGARLGWLIDPQSKSVEIYRANGEVEILSNPSAVSGEDILPGFALSLSRIWS